MQYDFDALNKLLHSRIRELLPVWLPGGVFEDYTFECGGPDGGIGAQLFVNLETGGWYDRDDQNLGGAGLTSLYMYIHDCTKESAYKELTGEYEWPNEKGKNLPLALPPVTPAAVEIGGDPIAYRMTPKGAVVKSIENAVAAVKNLGINIWFDEFYQRVLFIKCNDPVREWNDTDDIDLTFDIQKLTPLRSISEQLVSRAALMIAHQRTRNEPKDWLNNLAWDETDRIGVMLEKGFGAMPTDYVMAASRNFMISMVARIFSPGCKVDNMLVLEGNQGKGKSTALNVIGQPWFAEATDDFGSIEFLMSLQGKMLIEVAELDSFSKADARTIKKTVTCRVDRYRSKYGRHHKDHPRQCVFVGTTNEDEYLEDPTGGRRFWPIRVKDVDLDWIESNREQLFAEAVARFKRGETWWEMPEQAGVEQAERRRKDGWEDRVAEWVLEHKFEKGSRFSMGQIASQALLLETRHFGRREQMRLGAILRVLGCVKAHTMIGTVWDLQPGKEQLKKLAIDEHVRIDFPHKDHDAARALDNLRQLRKRD